MDGAEVYRILGKPVPERQQDAMQIAPTRVGAPACGPVRTGTPATGSPNTASPHQEPPKPS